MLINKKLKIIQTYLNVNQKELANKLDYKGKQDEI